jgi:hypothetical protein
MGGEDGTGQPGSGGCAGGGAIFVSTSSLPPSIYSCKIILLVDNKNALDICF